MADGWDPGRLGEPGQRPAPRLSPSPPTFLSISPSLHRAGVLLWRTFSPGQGKKCRGRAENTPGKFTREAAPFVYFTESGVNQRKSGGIINRMHTNSHSYT